MNGEQTQQGHEDVHILVVDDEEPIRKSLTRVLERQGYFVTAAASAEEAEGCMNALDFPLILADITMPGSSGLDLLARRAGGHPGPAFVMVTGLDDPRLAATALELGAYGYIIKPFGVNEIVINVTNALRRRSLEIENREYRTRLEEMLKERTSELWNAISELERAGENLRMAEEQTVTRLAMTAELKDGGGRGHVERMSRYCELIALELGLDVERARLLQLASKMHDLGNLGLPESLVQKTGSPSAEERALLESHTVVGHEILGGSSSDLLELAATIALTHHERFDGTGYPKGLEGDAIPLEGRIAAAADAFDRLTSGDASAKPVALGKAVELMQADAGHGFDASVVAALLGAMDEFLAVMQEHPVQS